MLVKLNVAGICSEIECRFPETVSMMDGFFAPDAEEPELFIRTDVSELEYEEQLSKEENGENVRLPMWMYENTAIYRKLCRYYLKKERLLIHGSAIGCGGRAYIFTAVSGTGKSTHTRLWRECYGDQVRMINDDKPILDLSGDTPTVCGTPWMGKHRLGENISMPLGGICILTRAKENSIKRITFSEALSDILRQTYRGETAEEMITALGLIDRLSGTPVYLLGCNISPEAAITAHDAMTKENKEYQNETC